MHNLRRIFTAVALVVVLAPLAASVPLFDPDEGLHAAIAQEMVRSGDYVTPRFLGEPFLDKPILFFWVEAASLRLFGHTETAVRLPPLLFGLAGMLSIALLARTLFGTAAGLTSGIVYGTMLLPFGVSQVAVHDIGVVPFMCVAAWCLASLAVGSASPSARRIVVLATLAGVCLGLSILTKGLVGVAFAGILGACLAVYRPAALLRLGIALTIAVVVAVLVAAPWYIAMERAHPGYLHYYFVERHLQGYLTATQRHSGRPFGYYLPIVVGGALPWTLHLAGAVQSARAHPLRLVVWGWFAAGLIFLSLGESKLLTYALPLFPALAILIGEYVHAGREPRREHAFTIAAWVQIVVLAVLPAAALLVLRSLFGAAPVVVWIPVALLALLTIDAGRRVRRAADSTGAIRWLAQASVYSIVAMMVVLPYLAAWMTAREFAHALNAGGVLPSRVSVLDERIGSLVFYLDPALRAEATPARIDESSFPEAIARARHDPDDAVLAVRNEQLAQFTRLFAQPPTPDAHAGTFTLFRAATLRRALEGATR